LLILYFRLELYGAAIACNIQALTNLVVIYILVHCFGYGRVATNDFSKNAFNGWWESIRLGIPSYFLQLFTFISIEIIVLMSAMVDVEILVANTALVNLLYIFYLYVYGVVMSCSNMIGNKIGEGNKEGARKLINANMMFGISFTILVQILFYILKGYLFVLYTNKQSVIDKMHMIYPMYS